MVKFKKNLQSKIVKIDPFYLSANYPNSNKGDFRYPSWPKAGNFSKITSKPLKPQKDAKKPLFWRNYR